MLGPFLEGSILGRAVKTGIIEVEVRNLRDWALGKHKIVDDAPYGGGAGMVLKVDVIDRALNELASKKDIKILLTPQGERFTQKIAGELADSKKHLVLIAGHYEGFDERVRKLVDREISIGDYILTGGELPAAVIVDTIARLVPGVLGNPRSLDSESHSSQRHDFPTYTRPDAYTPASRPELGILSVPDILKSGNHASINAWRLKQAQPR